MTDALTTSIATATADVAAIADPVERYQAARRVRTEIAEGDRVLQEIQQAIVRSLYEEGRTWADVGEAIGVSGSRAEAIAKGR